MEKLLRKVQNWKPARGSRGSRQAGALPLSDLQRTEPSTVNPHCDILPNASNVTMHHSHFHVAERINNTYNFQTDTQANEALQLLGTPKGCAWDPSRACLDGTRVDHIEAIMSWATTLEVEPTTPGARILLIPGPAGSGKSALAHTISRELNQRKLLVCSVFFDHPGQQPTAEDFTRALILGLCAMDDSVKKAIAELVVENRTLASASAVRQIQDIILPILPMLPPNRNFVVGIDALDEQANTTTLQLLRDHVPLLPSTFRFVLTTRPDRRVMQYLESRPHIVFFTHRLVGDKNDIEIFITVRLSQTDYSNDISPELLDAFIAKSEGLFLWAATVLNHIDNAYDHAAELADVVAGASIYWTEAEAAAGKLERLYEHILSKLEWKDPRFVKKYNIVVGALVTLQEPLSRRGLAELYSPDGITEDEIHGICMFIRPLLQNYSKDEADQPIHLLHLSVKEYLVQRAKQPFRIDCEVHHTRLARLCLRAIKRELTPENVPILGYSDGDWAWDVAEKIRPIPVLLRTSLPASLRYSIQYFDTHWCALREEADEELAALLRDVLVENPRPLLEVVASTRSMIDIISLQRQVLAHGPPSLTTARWMAKIYVSLARCLTLERRDIDALCLFREAVQLYAPHKDGNPDFAVELEFVTSLTGLGRCLYDIDCLVDATPCVEEALVICRALSLTYANETRQALTHSLETKSCLLDKMKQYGEAYKIDIEVLDLYRQLVVGQPDRFQHMLGSALRNLAWSHDACKKHGEAVVVMLEEVELCRKMVQLDPDTSAGLSTSLGRLAGYLRNAERLPEAVQYGQEAEEIWCQLASNDHEKYSTFWAESLHSVASHLYQCDRVAEAIPFSNKAIGILRQLAENDASAFEPSLAQALYNHALYIGKAGRPTEALEYGREAVKIRCRIVEDPKKYSAALAQSLDNLNDALDDCGRVDQTIRFSDDAIEICRQLVEEDPSTFEVMLADALHNHAIYLKIQKALKYRREADDIRSRLLGTIPDFICIHAQ
ncbi:hypothetical protein FA15DRAFT_97106 [Coprinopsis marcescibilis]|uniref:NACHT domain-containing protein n=1 Tax=Coprinopsis marcescibilis TaxID=230819 RepID=A0A5C3KM64_COPMA|nr:hypothetical protein FA15DRAFT_97106 [Coprinopsis marcescibilis]